MARKKDAAPTQGDDQIEESLQEDGEEADDATNGDLATEANSSADVRPEYSGDPVIGATESAAPAQGDLHSRVATAAAIARTAPQHVSGSLNKAEILLGGLKMALPAAIEAVDDESLRSDLTILLSIL